MKSVIASAVLAISTISAAAADKTITDLLENVCIASQLNRDLVKPNLVAMTDALGYRIADFPPENFRMLNPDAKMGWGIAAGDSQYLLFYSEKILSFGVSRSCTVANETDDSEPLRTFVKEKYDARLITDQRQGSFRITAFEVTMIGFEKPMLFTIQATEPGAQPMVSTISFFEQAK